MNREAKLQVVEIVLSVGLIAMLVYFHISEGKQHKEMMDALNGVKK